VLVLRSDDPREQLQELERRFALGQSTHPFTRCSRCNEPLEDASSDDLSAVVPPRVLEQQARFARCPRCARVYWHGSHVGRMRQWMDAIERD
jgi:uncharacterized protein with PIN domain